MSGYSGIDLHLTEKEQRTLTAGLLFLKVELDKQKAFTDRDVETHELWARSGILGANSLEALIGKIAGKTPTEMEQHAADMVSRDPDKLAFFKPHFND